MEISGKIGLNAEGKLEDGIETQTRRSIENIKGILEEAGWNLKNLIRVRIFLIDMGDYEVVNKVYSEYFDGEFPTRVALVVKEFPLGALIELDCSACGN
jgi:2-iminobutanoate/2-iminopropanoate deaminase